MKRQFVSEVQKIAKKCEKSGFTTQAIELYRNFGKKSIADKLVFEEAERAEKLGLYFIAMKLYSEVHNLKEFKECGIKFLDTLEKLYEKYKDPEILDDIIDISSEIGLAAPKKYLVVAETSGKTKLLWTLIYYYRKFGEFDKVKELLLKILQIELSGGSKNLLDLAHIYQNLGLLDKSVDARRKLIKNLIKQKDFRRVPPEALFFDEKQFREYSLLKARTFEKSGYFKKAAIEYSLLGEFEKAKKFWRKNHARK